VVAKTPIPKVVAPKPPVPVAVQPPPYRPPEKKPIPSISLEQLKDRNNNQRKPDAKHVADLRDALKAVVGNPPPRSDLKSDAQGQTLAPKRTGPSAEELKKILDVT